MNPAPLARAARAARAVRSASHQAGPSSAQLQPPARSDGRTLSASTLRSLVSLHHSSAGFLHSTTELATGFDNAFRYTQDPGFHSYFEFANSVQFNQSLHPAGGMENLVEKPRSAEARGMHMKGRTVMPAETVQKTFQAVDQLWSQTGGGSKGFSKRDQFMSDRELRVQEALYGTWERGGVGMDRVEPGLEGVIEYVQAKGKTVAEYAGEWQKRNDGAAGARQRGERGEQSTQSTEDGM
ncbi:hypothetical protein IAU60_002347 [Kwoniella sp. DSM 27419]